MNAWKKRGAALMLALVLALPLAACGENDDLRRTLKEAAKDAPIVESGVLPDELVNEGIESVISRVTSEVECTFAGGVLTISGDGAEIDQYSWIPAVSEAIFEPDEQECREAVEKVVMEDGVTKIWENTFAGCRNLKEVTIPDSVTFIGEAAFRGCSGWRIPEGADELADSFWSPGKLLNNEDAYRYCADYCAPIGIYPPLGPDELLEGTGLTHVELPDGLTYVGQYAFADCLNLISASNLSYVGDYMFMGCSLTDVQISEAAVSIGRGAFSDCGKLAEVVIPGGVTRIEDNAFMNCGSLKEIVLPENVTSAGSNLFIHSGLTKITIPANAAKWGNASSPGSNYYDYTVLDCENLTDITFLGDAALEDLEPMLYQPMQYARDYQYYNEEERPLTVRAPSGSVIEGYCRRQIEKGDAPFLTFIPI